MRFRILTAVVLSWFALSLAAFAQVSINGSLRGRVSDPGNAAIAGARLTLTNTATATTQITTSDSSGEYQFARLAPGSYRLTVEKDGFKKLQREGLRVSVNEAAVADLMLDVGAVSEVITVQTNGEITQTQTSSVSQIIETHEIADLPLNSKDFQKLTFLAPGVGGQRGNNSSTNFSVSGARDANNNYVVDGVSANDERQTAGLAPGNFGLTVPNVIPTESLREFRIITSNADATFGRGSGGQINVITKSGTNDFHGSLYEYLRNDALDARDFFNLGPFFNRDGKAKTPPFKQHLFGGSLGGRMFLPRFGEGGKVLADGRDKHFFFVNYEGFRQKLQATATAELPNADLINLMPGDLGVLSRAYYFDQGIVPRTGNRAGQFFALAAADRTAATAAGFNAALFDGNLANGEAGTVLVSSTRQQDYEQNALTLRTDHNFTEKLTGAFRYSFAANALMSNTVSVPLTERASPTRFHSGLAQLVYVFSPTQVIEVRGGILRAANQSGARVGALAPQLAALGISPEFGLGISVSGTTFTAPIISPSFVIRDNQTTPQVAALYTQTKGKATFRAGLDIRKIALNFSNNSFPTPSYSFTGIVGQTGLIGANPSQTVAVASSVNQTVFGRDPVTNAVIGLTTPQRGYRSTQQEYFVQSDYNLRRNFTLNLGVRYSYFGVYDEVNAAFGNLYATNSAGQIVPEVSPFAFGRTANVIAPIGADRPLYQPDKNNFQPRVGIAWDMFGKGKSVLRAAYGLYHDRLLQLSFSNLTNNPPYAFSGSLTSSASVADRTFRIGQIARVSPRANPIIFAVDPTIKNPESQRFSLAFEQELDRNTSVNVAYVGLRGRKLIRTLDPNFAGAYPQAARPDVRFADQRILINGSKSEYDALQIYARRRFATFAAFTVSYTLGHLLDDTSTDTIFSTVPTNINLGANPAVSGIQTGAIGDRPFNVDKGSSEIDIRHNLVVSHVIQLPFGKGRKFLANADGLLNALIGGFELTGIGVFRSGARFNVTTGTDYNEDGATNDRPALLSGHLNDLYNRGGNDPTLVLLPATDARLRLGQPANVLDPFAQIPRNAFRAPNVRYYDISIGKRFQFSEAMRLGVEANIFNLTNTANFRAPNSTLSSSLFGRTTGTAATTNPRQIQLGIKLAF
ncbi:MAG: carboxypeptidase regulatory-like domain-containing protein [Acidobacteria bacterium]|nr:carboxypeptidase regulatory-like domain-containing protein [Acidobacteriota bacterium]